MVGMTPEEQRARALLLLQQQQSASSQQGPVAPPPPESSPFMEGPLGYAGQAASGVNEGLANILGLPVDLMNAGVGLGMSGLNAVAGTDFQPSEQPFLGSQSIRGMLDPTILPESEDPSMQFTRRVGEEVGATLPMALAGPAGLMATELGLAGASGIGAATAQQVMPGNDTAEILGSLAGLGVGAAGPNALRRVVTPNPSNATREELAQALMSDGVDLTAGQRTGSTPLRYMESELGGSSAVNLIERQGEQFTSAALGRAGISADRATPEVMSQAYRDLGNRFDEIAGQTTVAVDPQFGTDVVDAVSNYMDLVPEASRAPIVTRTLDDLTDLAERASGDIASIPGDQYQAYRSRLGRAASSTTDPELRSALFDIQAALDDAAERTLAVTNPSLLDDWSQLRGEYRNFLILDRAAGAAGEAAAQGIISPAQLAGAVRGVAGRRAYSQGTNDLSNLARSGVGVMTPLPNSGTASRLAARGLPSALGAGLGGMTGDTLMTMGGAIAAPALSGMAGRGMLTGPMRSYLGNQVALPSRLPPGAVSAPATAILANQGQSGLSPLAEYLMNPEYQ